MSTRRHVLVVDDNVDAAESLKILLECWGHAVELEHDGHAALAHAERHPPDVVLLDIGLPGLDGYEVARRLRERQSGPAPLLVAVTGYGRGEDRDRAHAAGFDRHLVKPLDLDLLRDLLDEHGQPPVESRPV